MSRSDLVNVKIIFDQKYVDNSCQMKNSNVLALGYIINGCWREKGHIRQKQSPRRCSVKKCS